MKTLRQLTEELSGIIDFPSRGVVTTAKDLPSYQKVMRLVRIAMGNMDPSGFNPRELSAINDLRVGVEFAQTMAPNTARGYIGAICQNGIWLLLRRLAFGGAVERALNNFLAGGPTS